MTRLFIINSVFFIVLSLIYSCSSTLKYSGVVRSEMDQNIASAKVVIKTDKGKSVANTDASGNFEFTEIKSDTTLAFITISADGFDPYNDDILLHIDMPDYPHPFTLRPAQTRVYGFVKSNEGTLLSLARVFNTIYGEEFSERTDKNGKFSMTLEDTDVGVETELIAFKQGFNYASIWVTPEAYKTIQVEDIILEKKEGLSSTVDVGGEREIDRIEQLGGGITSHVDEISASSATDDFLVQYRGKYFKKQQFIDYISKRGIAVDSAESELKTLIKMKKVKRKINSNKYYVIPN